MVMHIPSAADLPPSLQSTSVAGFLSMEQQARDGQSPIDPDAYWAARSAEDVIGVLKTKRRQYKQAAQDMGFEAMWRVAGMQYFGRDDFGWMAEIKADGQSGELLRFRVNETRSYIEQMITMAIGNRPAFECSATNTDYDSIGQAEIADNIVGYVYDQRFGERKERRTIEYGTVFGHGSTWIRWDPSGGTLVKTPDMVPGPPGPDGSPGKPLPRKDPATGKEVQVPHYETQTDPATGQPVIDPATGMPVRVPTGKRTGDLVIKALSPWNQFHETSIDDEEDHLWRCVVERRSKHELAALFPTKRDAILAASSLDIDGFDDLWMRGRQWAQSQSDEIPVIHFYHLASDALKPFHDRQKSKGLGRYMVIAGGVDLIDTVMPTRAMPVIDYCPSPFIGTSFGYANSWDMGAVNQMADNVVSDIASNLSTFGRMNVWIEEGLTVTAAQLANGMKVLVGKPGSKPPVPLLFGAIPEASKWFLDTLRRFYQSISGLNATSRGETDANVTSGTMAALFHSIAIEHASSSIAAVDHHRERIANLILDILKVYAEHPMIVQIAGNDERAFIDTFKRDDLYGVRGVTLKTANPMMRTQVGRMELAQLMLKVPGAINDPAQINEIVVSGQMKPLYDTPRKYRLAIKWENEALADGPPVQEMPMEPGQPIPGTMMKMPDKPPWKYVPTVPASVLDNHQLHIDSHEALKASRSVQSQPDVLAAVNAHIEHHKKVWCEADPAFLRSMGRPLWQGPPPAYTQAPQMPPGPMPPPLMQPPRPGAPPPNGPPGAQPSNPPSAAGPQQPKPAPAAMQPTDQPKQMTKDMGVPIPKPAQSPIGPQPQQE